MRMIFVSLEVLDGLYLVNDVATGCVDGHLVALCLANERSSDRRIDRDQVRLGVCLIFTHDPVGYCPVILNIDQRDGGTEDDFAGNRNRGHIDNLRVRQLVLEFFYAPLGEALLLSRSMVFSILLEITMLSRLGNRLGDPRALNLFQTLQLLSKDLLSSHSHRNPDHMAILSCRSCRRRTVISVSCSNAIQTASAAANVVV